MNAIDAMKKEYEAARTEQERRHQVNLFFKLISDLIIL
jgi:hypothetical protein